MGSGSASWMGKRGSMSETDQIARDKAVANRPVSNAVVSGELSSLGVNGRRVAYFVSGIRRTQF